jgi:outer membrane protein assembly factor BamB
MKRLAPVFAGLLWLSGCSWFGGDSGEPPAALTDYAPQARIETLWSRDIGRSTGAAYLRLQPAIHRDVLYVTDVRGRVQALDRASGEPRWQTELNLDITGGVGFGDDLVLVASRKGVVVALDKAGGKEQWRAQVASEILAPPVADYGVVVVHSVDGRLTALASASGKQLWSVARTEPALSLRGTATPVIVSDVAFTGFATGRLVAVSLKEGRVVWEIPVTQPQGRTEIERLVDVDAPVLVAGRVLVAAAYQGKIVSLSLETGRLLWSREISTATALAADGGNVYVSDARGHVYALDMQTGATLWKQDKLQGRRLSAPAVVGNAVAVGDFDGYVHWLARDDGRFLVRERVAGDAVLTAPQADGATLYVVTQNAKLAALRIDPLKR